MKLLNYKSIEKEIKKGKDESLRSNDLAYYFMCGLLEKFFEEIPMVELDMEKVCNALPEVVADYVVGEISKLIIDDE